MINESSDSDDEYVYSTDKGKSKIPKVTVQIKKVDGSMIVDTGASTDIIDDDTFNHIAQQAPIQLGPTTKRLFAYGQTPYCRRVQRRHYISK